MARIGLIVRSGVPDALTLGQELEKWCQKKGHKLVYEHQTAELFSKTGTDSKELVAKTDLIVSLGGDGTLIGVARYVNEKSPLMLGVNFGNLGFLTEISPDELFSVLETVFSGKVKSGERSMLEATVIRKGKVIFESQAVNDVVIQKGAKEKLPEIDLAVNDEPVMRIRGDGLIFATPTGSTAYNLAAGGSIVYPSTSMAVTLVTPICPHSLTNRPFIIPSDRTITAAIPDYQGELDLIVDGQVSVRMRSGDIAAVTRGKHNVRFVKSPSCSYYEILRKKLNWGIANKA